MGNPSTPSSRMGRAGGLPRSGCRPPQVAAAPVWIDAQAVRLRPRGHVPVAFSNGRRNDGPNQPTLRVTHRPEIVPTRHMIAIYRRRWGVEVLCQAWQGVVGMGQHQVPKQVDRVERSVAVAIMAYLLRLKLRAKAIPADRPWSAFRLLRAFAWEMEQAQGERLAWPIARKWLQMANAA